MRFLRSLFLNVASCGHVVLLLGMLFLNFQAFAGSTWEWPNLAAIREHIGPEVRQMVIAEGESWNSMRGKVFLFERESADAPWMLVESPMAAVFGQKGLAPSADKWPAGWSEARSSGGKPGEGTDSPFYKSEGDGKSPAGIFSLKNVYGYAGKPPSYLAMPYTLLTSTLFGVDDPDSRFYNQIVDVSHKSVSEAKDWKSAETMRRKDDLYRWLVVVDHNSARRPGEGSQIFLHVWRSPDKGTAGCTAVSLQDMETLLEWLKPEKNPVLVQYPKNLFPEEPNRAILSEIPSKKIAGREDKGRFGHLNDPEFTDGPGAASFLKDDDAVFLLTHAGRNYVFPQLLMSWHHVVNLSLKSTPVAVTYCMLADSAVAFRREVGGMPLELGVRGTLLFGDAVLYDRQTNSSFLQLTGDGFQGIHAQKRLPFLARLEQVSFKAVKGLPELKVLAPQKELRFYRDFYERNLDYRAGFMSFRAASVNIDQTRRATCSGLGFAGRDEQVFVGLDALAGTDVLMVPFSGGTLELRQNKVTQEISADFRSPAGARQAGEPPFQTQVFWYNWKAFFPGTRAIGCEGGR